MTAENEAGMAASRVTRKVHFYRVGPKTPTHAPLDVRAILEEVQVATADGDIYVPHGEHQLCGWIDRTAPNQQMRLAVIRRHDLPLIDRGHGLLRALDLAEEEGIADSIHVVFFPDRIVGAEFNFYGPRMTALATYLADKAPNCPSIEFRHLIRRDFDETLRRLGTIRLIDLRIRTSYVPTLNEVDASLADAIRSASELGDMHEVELILRPKARDREWHIGERARETLRRLLQREDVTEGVKKLRIEGDDDGQTIVVDLLEDHVLYEREMMKVDHRTRAVSRHSAYREIHTAYTENYQELLSAPSI